MRERSIDRNRARDDEAMRKFAREKNVLEHRITLVTEKNQELQFEQQVHRRQKCSYKHLLNLNPEMVEVTLRS